MQSALNIGKHIILSPIYVGVWIGYGVFLAIESAINYPAYRRYLNEKREKLHALPDWIPIDTFNSLSEDYISASNKKPYIYIADKITGQLVKAYLPKASVVAILAT